MGVPSVPRAGRAGGPPQPVPTAGHSEQLRAAPRLVLATAVPRRTTAHRHLLLGYHSPGGMAAGRNRSATVLAPRLPCHGSAGTPAIALVPPAALGAGVPGCKAEHGGASAGTAAPTETDRPCLTGALTGKAFPLHADSLASTDIPLSHRANHRLQPRSVPASPPCHRPRAGSLRCSPRACPLAGTEPGLQPCHPGHPAPATLPHMAMHRLLPPARSTRNTCSALSGVPTVPTQTVHVGQQG